MSTKLKASMIISTMIYALTYTALITIYVHNWFPFVILVITGGMGMSWVVVLAMVISFRRREQKKLKERNASLPADETQFDTVKEQINEWIDEIRNEPDEELRRQKLVTLLVGVELAPKVETVSSLFKKK
ncbi:hypothetical protein C6P08_05400 [Weissella confusa]|uniref:hypothetical protein n=1 Tax=Weissella confusa TaxID=1583 RepID=UPI001091C3A0|nr:hypothetical protein [Weissella confusa]MBJ7695102.1 MFS transporter [Weissella confusa]QBZ04641.1 hypothetical protein C6P08_05400 [Weissella confusa]